MPENVPSHLEPGGSTQGLGKPNLLDRFALSQSIDASSCGIELLLFGLQSPINLGMILRVAETFKIRVSILDLVHVLADPEKKKATEDFACGAMARRPPEPFDDPAIVAQMRQGRRLIATSIGPNSISLPKFEFQPGDIVVLGNEYDGLPDDVFASADALLNVPMPDGWLPKKRSHKPIDPSRMEPVARDGQPNLNVAMTAGIICYAVYLNSLAGRVSMPNATALPETEAAR